MFDRFGIVRLVLVAALSNVSVAGELERAALKGDLDTVKAAIEASDGQDHMDLLFEASQAGHLPIVRYLLKRGANPDMTTYNDFTPLHLASEPSVVEELLKYDPDLSREAGFGQTALEQAAAKAAYEPDGDGNWNRITKLLLQAGADYNINTAIYLDDIKRVRELLKKAPELGDGDWEHPRPLWIAATCGRTDVVRMLLDRGVNPDWGYGAKENPDELFLSGWPIFIDAIDRPDIVKLLIEAGADVTSPVTFLGGRSGLWIIGDEATSLHHAAASGAVESARLLLSADVPLDAQDDRGQTALHIAVYFDQPQMVRFLLERGADHGLKDLEGNTPLDLADSEAVAELIEGLSWAPVGFAFAKPHPVLRPEILAEVRTLLRQARGPVEAAKP